MQIEDGHNAPNLHWLYNWTVRIQLSLVIWVLLTVLWLH